MAITLIKENLRNPVTNTWIPLRQIEGDNDGNVTTIKQLGVDEYPLNYVTPEPGVMVPSDGTEMPVIPYPIGYKEGEVTPLKTTYIFQNGEAVNSYFPYELTDGQFFQLSPIQALTQLDLETKEYDGVISSFSWDGDTTEKTQYNDYFYKVADEYISIDTVKEIRISRVHGDGAVQSAVLNVSSVDQITDGYYSISFPTEGPEAWDMPLACYVIDSNQAKEEGISTGIYFAKYEDTGGELIYYVSSLDFIGYNIIDIPSGGTGASTPVEALHNFGITWGTNPAESTGIPGSIYIQLLPTEE